MRSAPSRSTGRPRPSAPALARGRRVLYVCLQARREGQASFTHVAGIVEGLRAAGDDVRLVEPDARDQTRPWARLVRMATTQVRALGYLAWADVAYVRWHFATLPIVAAAKLLRVPVVVEVNGTDEDFVTAWPSFRHLSWLIGGAARWQLRLADGSIAVTESLGTWIASRAPGARIAIVPNAADVDMFSPRRPRHPDVPERYVVFVGVLAPWQGVEVMLRAARQPGWPAGVPLVIVGDGAGRAACEAAADASTIVYLGRRPHAEIPSILAGAVASISVQTPISGRGEIGCTPIKLFEGLACGRPVVISDLPGMREIVQQEACGVVVRAGDSIALASAIARLSGDARAADEMGRRGREAVVRGHSWDARARATRGFIESVVER